MAIKGIDVSKWNGVIDWGKVKNSGVDFVMIREGYGKKSPTQVDKKFRENITQAQNYGINCGVYHYGYADSTKDAQDEAEFCLENIQNLKLEYPVVFDFEDKETLKLSTRQRTDICMAFLSEIEKNGYYAMIYANKSWLENYLYATEILAKYDLWLAQWGPENPSYNCGIWQYSETGRIDGINGNVDLNFAYKDYPFVMKRDGLNGFKRSNPISTNNAGPQYFEYTVQKGDTLWDLAKKYLGNGARCKEIKELNFLSSDTIYVGKTIKIPK